MTTAPYITCEELIRFVLDYVDGSLPSNQRVEFDRHLSVCPSCVAYLDGYRKSIELARAAFGTPPAIDADSMPEALRAAILASRKPS